MNIFGMGLPEMVLIMVIALLVFGPKKLPEIGRSLGKAIRGFQDASKEFENQFNLEAQQIEQGLNTPNPSESDKIATKEVATAEVATAEVATAESNNHATTSSQQS